MSLGQSNPLRKQSIRTIPHKNMDVIWHDHKTTNRDATWLALSSELNELPVNSCIGEQSFPAMGVKRHKVQRWIVFLKTRCRRGGALGIKASVTLQRRLCQAPIYDSAFDTNAATTLRS